MKSQLSSIDLHYVVQELQSLINSRVQKIYSNRNELIIQLNISDEGKKLLKILIGKYLHLTEYKEEYHEPSSFCQYLRKSLENSRLKKIEQLGCERIIKFTFEAKEGIRYLYIELFSQGNAVLCDETGRIMRAIICRAWKDREIKPDVEYVYPKTSYDFFNLKHSELKELLKNSKKDSLVTCLASALGLGGLYAEEASLISSVDKNKSPSKIDEKESNAVLKAVNSLKAKKISANVVYDKGNAVDIVPFELEFYKDMEKKGFKSFNNAMDHYFTHEYREEKPTVHGKELERLNFIIKTQQEKIKELESLEKEDRSKGELLYHKYQLVNEILQEINKASKTHDWQYIKEKLRGHKIIKDIDLKEKTVTLEL